MLTLEIFWGLNEIIHIKHLDLYQIHEAHSVKNNENYAESYGMAVSLSQKHWPTAWAGQQLLLTEKMWRWRFPRERLGQKSRHSLGHTEAFHSRTNGSAASVHTAWVSTDGQRQCPRRTFSFQSSWESKVWGSAATGYVGKELHKPQKSPRARNHPMVMTPKYLIPFN